MAIKTSGSLSMTEIVAEFGGSASHSLSEYYSGGSYVPSGASGINGAIPSSGSISFSHFYGAQKASSIAISGSASSGTSTVKFEIQVDASGNWRYYVAFYEFSNWSERVVSQWFTPSTTNLHNTDGTFYCPVDLVGGSRAEFSSGKFRFASNQGQTPWFKLSLPENVFLVDLNGNNNWTLASAGDSLSYAEWTDVPAGQYDVGIVRFLFKDYNKLGFTSSQINIPVSSYAQFGVAAISPLTTSGVGWTFEGSASPYVQYRWETDTGGKWRIRVNAYGTDVIVSNWFTATKYRMADVPDGDYPCYENISGGWYGHYIRVEGEGIRIGCTQSAELTDLIRFNKARNTFQVYQSLYPNPSEWVDMTDTILYAGALKPRFIGNQVVMYWRVMSLDYYIQGYATFS